MTPSQARGAYRRQISQHGETMTLRRINPSPAAASETSVRGRITSYLPQEMVGEITTADRKIIVLAEDLEGTSWPVPPRKNDKIVVHGKVFNISEVDDETRRIAGVLIAYEITARA